MKKLIPIVLTTGLLVGTVAFGAMACGRDGAPDEFQPHKQIHQQKRYAPNHGKQAPVPHKIINHPQLR